LKKLPQPWGNPVAPVGFLGNVLEGFGLGDVMDEIRRIREELTNV